MNKMKKIILSYTTINNYHISPHSWLNRVLGVKVPETEYMIAGREAHKRIQDHCLGVKKDDRLLELDWAFQKAEVHARKDWDDKFLLHGFLDMVNYKSKVFAEIKTSTNAWSQQRFDNLMQWRYYAYVTGLRKVLFITCHADCTALKTFYTDITDEDIAKAEEWVTEAITGIENGIFKTDLSSEGFCNNPRCPYNSNCYFLV